MEDVRVALNRFAAGMQLRLIELFKLCVVAVSTLSSDYMLCVGQVHRNRQSLDGALVQTSSRVS